MKYTMTSLILVVNPFPTACVFLYPLITSENQRISDVFRGYRNSPWHEIEWLIGYLI